jgi:hypothetical protein
MQCLKLLPQKWIHHHHPINGLVGKIMQRFGIEMQPLIVALRLSCNSPPPFV